MVPITVDGPTADAWVRSVANALFWEDNALWTGKDDVPYGDPKWMSWRSSSTVGAFEERARTFVPPEVYAVWEAWDGEVNDPTNDPMGESANAPADSK